MCDTVFSNKLDKGKSGERRRRKAMSLRVSQDTYDCQAAVSIVASYTS